MNESQISSLFCVLDHTDISHDFVAKYLVDVEVDEFPFSQCKIIEVTHDEIFAPHPHTPRYFELEGDRILNRGSMVEPDAGFRTYWLPLTPQDDWGAVLWKADKLAAMSGDRHHRLLESFEVVGDILIPNFGS